MSTLSTQPSFLTHSNSSTRLSIPPPSSMPSIFMSSVPPPSISHILSTSSTMSTILSPPTMSPSSSMSSILPPSSTMSTVPPPFMSTILSPSSTMSTILSPPFMSTILSPSSTMSTILSPPFMSTILPPSPMSFILSPSSSMSTILPPSTMSSILSPSSSISTILSNLSTVPTILSPLSSTLLPSQNTLTPDVNQTCSSLSDDEALAVPLAVLYSVLFLLGLAGNVPALWVFLFLRRRWDSLHVFLTNSAVADLLLLACLPFRVHYYANGNKWELGDVACKLVINVFYMNMYVNIVLLGFISLDRYAWLRRRAGRARRHSLRSPCGVPWAWVVCGLVWALALGLMAYVVVKTTEEAPTEEAPTEEAIKCFHHRLWVGGSGRCIAYVNTFLEVMFWVVFVAQVVSYGKIATSRHGSTARKSFFVLLLFTLCFVPYHAFRPFYIHHQLFETSCQYQLLMHRTQTVMVLFSAFNSCLDPVMYFLLSGLMRKVAARVLCTHSYSLRDGEGL